MAKHSTERRMDILISLMFNEKLVSTTNPSYGIELSDFFVSAVRRDMGVSGDISTMALGKMAGSKVSALVLSKNPGIAAGMEDLKFLFNRKYPFFKGPVVFFPKVADGDRIAPGQALAVFKGYACDILLAERTVLNFLQRMCGIATLARKYADALPKNVIVCATRKTLLGAPDKKAVLTGGGGTHRMNLSDALLIKDNHLKLVSGGPEMLFRALLKNSVKGRFIEVEVSSVSEARQMMEAFSKICASSAANKPFLLMLDNFRPAHIKKALGYALKRGLRERIFFEASGGINLKNIGSYANTGVDIISAGALTNSAPSLDISLELHP